MPIQSFTLGTGETRVAARNKDRTSLTLANADAAQTVFFRDGAGVSSENGIPIPPNGTAVIKIPEDDPTTDWFAAASAANVSLRVMEQVGKR